MGKGKIAPFPTVFSKDLKKKEKKGGAFGKKTRINCLLQKLTLRSSKPRTHDLVVVEFDPRLRRTFFPAQFRLSPLQKHVSKLVSGFGKKSCVSSGVRKPGNL